MWSAPFGPISRASRRFSAWWLTPCGTKPAQLRAGLDAALREPALCHLQRKDRRARRAMRLLAMRLHAGDVDDHALRVDERHRQRDVGVLHPHAVWRGLVEDE